MKLSGHFIPSRMGQYWARIGGAIGLGTNGMGRKLAQYLLEGLSFHFHTNYGIFRPIPIGMEHN